MDSFNFYKSLYERELNRRKDLDASINIPLTLISILVTINAFLIKEIFKEEVNCIRLMYFIVFLLFVVSICISIYYLSKSYNNFFKGFAYKNLAKTSEIRKFEKDLEIYNKSIAEDKRLTFEEFVLNRIISITDDNILFNDERSKDLYKSKSFLIFSIFTTGANFIIFSIKYLNI